ncbi:MAG: hypothetical protein WC429_21145, partial [Verrucomicrobiia bacterium]
MGAFNNDFNSAFVAMSNSPESVFGFRNNSVPQQSTRIVPELPRQSMRFWLSLADGYDAGCGALAAPLLFTRALDE